MERTLRLPEAFRERLALQLGDQDAARLLVALGEKRVRALRVNCARTTPEALRAELQAAGFKLEPAPSPFADAMLVTSGRLRDLQATEAHQAGRFCVQGLTSMAAVLALDLEPGQSVLDLCAAPGLQTCQIAAALQSNGRLVANERSRKRDPKLRAALQSQGVLDFVELTASRGESLARSEPAAFDRILVDAPCSAEAEFHLDQENSWADWRPSVLRRLAGQQRKLLLAAATALRPAGVLVYATCTFAPEENEVVLHKLLRRLGDELDLVPLPFELPGSRPGLTRWGGRNLDPRLSRARLCLPNGAGEGGFIARLEKRA